jgi:hypothetical protein
MVVALAQSKLVKMNWRKIILVIALAILVVCLGGFVWLLWSLRNFDPFTSSTYQPVPTDTYEIAVLEGNADIKLPESAREIYTYTTGFREIFVMSRFEIDANELEEFIDSTLCTQPLERTSPRLQPKLEGNPSWWTPYTAEHLEECYGENEHSHQHVLVDMTASDIYIVYVSNSVY